MFTCKICNREFPMARDLSNHIRFKHSMSSSEYWLKYLKPNDFDPLCIICHENPKKFLTIAKGYSPICTNKSCMGKYVDSTKKERYNINSNHYQEYICGVCGREFPSLFSLTGHLFGCKKSCHNNTLTRKSYYDLYLATEEEKNNKICPICNTNERFFRGMRQGYSPTCKSRACIGKYGNDFIVNREERYPRTFKEPIECQICHLTCEGTKGLSCHIVASHPNIKLKTYYDKYFKQENEGVCKYCGSKTKFKNLTHGYHIICDKQKCLTSLIIDAKIESGSYGSNYSFISVNTIFKPIADQYSDRQDIKFFYGENEFYENVLHNPLTQKYNYNIFFYDFAIVNYKIEPLLICEFHGTEFHIKEKDLWKYRRKTNFYGCNMLDVFRRDMMKQKVIQDKYPDCIYHVIWEDNMKSGADQLIDLVKNLLKDPVGPIIDVPMRKNLDEYRDTECELCHKKFVSRKGLGSHLRQAHKMTLEDIHEYYDKYLLNESKLCPICKENEKKFIGLTEGYTSTCLIPGLNCRFKWMNLFK